MKKNEKHNLSIKTSGDFEHDPEGALDALDATGCAIFMISEKWFEDKRAVKEWRYARDAKKPMIYIFRNTEKLVKIPKLEELMMAPTLIGTINDYGDTEATGKYIQAMIAAFCKVNDVEI